MRRYGRWLRPLVGVAVLLGLVAYVGPEAVLRGVAGIDPVVALVGVALTALCTALSAWRWVAVARAGGLALRFRDAVSAYYRSQLVNLTVPGGVVGDVDRAVWHARDQRDGPRAGGAVVVERSLGQAVQLLVVAGVLLAWGSAAGLSGEVTVVLAVACLVFGAVALAVGGATQVLRPDRASARLAVPVLVASVLVLAGYTALFVVTARAVGLELPAVRLVPLALIVIVGSAIPVHVAGWGPREGIAAWAFTSVGLGAELGLAASVAYGLVSLIAVLPGLVPIIRGRGTPSRDHQAAVGAA